MTDQPVLTPEVIARQASEKVWRLKAEHRQALRLMRAKHAEAIAEAKYRRASAVELAKLRTSHVDELTTLQVTQADEASDARVARLTSWDAFQESQRASRGERQAAKRASAKPVGRPRKDGQPAGSVEYPQVTDEFLAQFRMKKEANLTAEERDRRTVETAQLPTYWGAITAATGLALPEKVNGEYVEIGHYDDVIAALPLETLRKITAR